MRNVRDPLHHEIEAINTPVGLTLIRKSKARAQGQRSKRPSKIALVLAGGAMTGGAFKMGGLKALNDFLVGRDIVDFDIYVGLSAGASAPEILVDAIIDAFRSRYRLAIELAETAVETEMFPVMRDLRDVPLESRDMAFVNGDGTRE